MKLSIDKQKVTSGIIILVAGAVAVSTVVLAAGGGMGGGPGGGGGRGGNMGAVELSESVISVKLESPTTGSLTRDTEFIGKIEAVESVSVFPEISGKVTAVHFDAGQSVRKGDLLFEIDDSDAQLSYEIAQASYDRQVISANTTLGSSYDSKILNAKNSLESAQRNLTLARQNLSDYNDDSSDDLISAEKAEEKIYAEMKALQSEIEEKEAAGENVSDLKTKLTNIETDYSLARTKVNDLDSDSDTQLRSLRNSYKTAQSNYENAKAEYELLLSGSLEDTQLGVDADLKSASLSLEKTAAELDKYKVYAPTSGVIETKSINTYENASAGSAAYTISNKDTMVVKFNASADAATALSMGDVVTISKGGKDYNATIIEIEAKADDSTGLFPIKARIDEGDQSLLSGVTVKVTAATQKAEDALLIPIDLVYYDDGQPYVFTYSDGKAHRTDIETGMSNSETVVVTSGLTTQSPIITTWHPDLKEGAAVTLAEGQIDPATGKTVTAEDTEQAAATADESGKPAGAPAGGAQPDGESPATAGTANDDAATATDDENGGTAPTAPSENTKSAPAASAAAKGD